MQNFQYSPGSCNMNPELPCPKWSTRKWSFCSGSIYDPETSSFFCAK